MSEQYSEKLISGGELIVTNNSWYIKYYFSGPDLRYNGTFVSIDEKEIDKYIQAWKENYEKYLMLKERIPAGGTFDTSGEMGMSIRIGFSEGVCLRSYHMPINTRDKLNQIISDYITAKDRAEKLQAMLKLI